MTEPEQTFTPPPNPFPATSPKSFVTTFLLCFFLGTFGIHRFYVGKTGTGVAQLLTLGGLGIWALVDLIIIMAGKFKDAAGLVVRGR